MALFQPIPMPGVSNIFSGLGDELLKRRQLEQEGQLKKAQAAKANMETSMFNQILGIPENQPVQQEPSMLQKITGLFGNEQPKNNLITNQTPQNNSIVSPIDNNQKMDLVASMLGFKPEHHYEGGKEYTYNPLTGTRERVIGETPQQKREAESAQKNKDILSKANITSFYEGQDYATTISMAKKYFTDPKFIEMGKLHRMALSNPKLRDITQLVTSKEHNRAFGNANAVAGDLVSRAAKNFKGAFTGRVEGIVNSYKPQPGEDADLSYGKIAAIEALHNIGQDFRKLVNKYQKSGMDAFDAIEQAQKDMPIEEIINRAQQAQQRGIEEYNSKNKNTSTIASTVTSNNKVKYTPEQIDQYSKDLLDKGYSIDKVQLAVEKMNAANGA